VYVPNKASVVGKVNSDSYGSFGGSPWSGEGGVVEEDDVQWEVGAVSRCGIRSSNEDSYLVLNDLLGGAGAGDGGGGGGEPIVRNKSTSFFKSFQSHGIFAIFDGHCGNHTARFATEKTPINSNGGEHRRLFFHRRGETNERCTKSVPSSTERHRPPRP